MYRIIGADGKEYGPVDRDQVRQWINDVRASAETMVQPEGETGWKKLSEVPELAELLGATAVEAPVAGAHTTYVSVEDPRQMVQGPAIGLIVTAAMGALACVLGLLMNVFGIATGTTGMEGMNTADMPEWFDSVNAMSGAFGIGQAIVGIALSGLILMGALKMKRLENYTLVMIATIVAMIPCCSPCCLFGLPIGIWALVVLSKPEVKNAFD